MFGPKVLEVIESPMNGKLEVRQLGRDIYVTTGGLTQSGGLINELWSKTFKKIPKEQLANKRWLVLGLATGTVAKIIAQKYSPVKITGVEIDPVMLDIGQRYFELKQIPHLEIINLDARRYVLDAKGKFDVVLVDLYVGDQLPKFVYSLQFISGIRKISQLAIFNHLFYDSGKKTKAEALVNQLKSVFPIIKLHRELTNLLVICG